MRGAVAHKALTERMLQSMLTRRLALRDAQFFLEKVGGRLIGNVVSPSFSGKRDLERQQLLWDALPAELGPDSVRRVGMLLAYTPEEWNIDDDATPVEKRRKRAG